MSSFPPNLLQYSRRDWIGSTLSLKTDGSVLKGSQMADGNSTEIFDGIANGAAISWKVSITDPMPMTLEFNGTINGDEVAAAWY
jgi:hypothetical protein